MTSRTHPRGTVALASVRVAPCFLDLCGPSAARARHASGNLVREPPRPVARTLAQPRTPRPGSADVDRLRRVLRAEGYIVYLAADGPSVVERLAREPPIDVVLIDGLGDLERVRAIAAAHERNVWCIYVESSGASVGFICNVGFHLCGGACVSDSATTSCGSSCSPCAVPLNGAATCDGTSCGFSCNSGYHACGAVCASDTSPATCGSSCAPCPAPMDGTATCTGGACGYTCSTGFSSCGGGCGCGAGCTSCSARANAASTCSAGACGFTCNPGFADCDGSPSNGCETSAIGAGNSILFCDGFEAGLGNWFVDAYWAQSTLRYAGNYSMEGTAGSSGSSCDRSGNTSMVLDVNLSAVTAATLYFRSWSAPGSLDTMYVFASANGGATWTNIASASRVSSWLLQTVSLAAYVGQPTVRIRFQFTNRCGDCCGVDWLVDNVQIEAR